MKKYLFIVGIIFITLLYNINSIFSFSYNFIGNDYFAKGNFKKANYYYDAALKYKNSEDSYKKIFYDKANAYYKLGEYDKAYSIYKKIDDVKNDYSVNHNIGNVLYRIGEKQTDVQEKIGSWKKSLEAYENALSIKYDEKTKKNFDFVQEKLEKLKEENGMSEKKDEKDGKKDGEKKDGKKGENKEGKDGQNGDKKEGDKKGENKDSQNGQDGKNGEGEKKEGEGQQGKEGEKKEGQEGKQGEKGNEGEKGKQGEQMQEGKEGGKDGQKKSVFTDQQQQEIKDYMKNLEKGQQDNQGYFNRQKKDQQNDVFQQFFNNDPFFNNGNGGNSIERDW